MGPATFRFPASWQARLAGCTPEEVSIGWSGAAVWRLRRKAASDLFLKTERLGACAELPGEAERLRWLVKAGMECPAVLNDVFEDGQHFILMTALPGNNLCDAVMQPDRVVALAAQALRRLHAIDPALCPFDHRLEVRIRHARSRFQAGLVDEEDFDEERQGIPAGVLIQRLVDRRPSTEDLVVTHGDACMPNLIAQGEIFTGFVDCGRTGVADRHQDLALASASIRYNHGDPWDRVFLSMYGGEIDFDRLSYYRLLDEFF